MSDTPNAEQDDSTPQLINAKFLPHEFGILFPSESGLKIQKQTGGVMCKQLHFSGRFLPLSRPFLHRGYPEWVPKTDEGRMDAEAIPSIDLESIPERDYNALPEWIQDRGHFYNAEQLYEWVRSDDVWWYGSVDLISELRKFNYDPGGNILDRRMLDAWENVDEIWDVINERLRFTYEDLDVSHTDLTDEDVELPIDPEKYPKPCEGVRWIRITGSTRYKGKIQTPWAEQAAGTSALLLYPNSD